ncbi:DUF1302 domain-containing protein [Cupriavidus lacunae]
MRMQQLGLGRPPARWRKTLVAMATTAVVMPAWAGDTIDLGADTTLDYHMTLGYGVGIRTRSPSGVLLAPENINGDDGDRNFKKGGLIENQVSLLAEADLKHKDLGFFLRFSAFYDQAYHRPNANDAPDTVNHDGPSNRFTSDAQRYLGERVKLLSAYAYDTVKLGSTDLNVKLGSQVVAWGESLFFANIAAAQGPVDASKGYVAGAEVKDILLPTPQLSLQWQLAPSFSVLGYYQFQFRPNELVPPGGYFSFSDVVGPGAQFIIGPDGLRIPRGPDIKPKSHNQWGLGTRWRADKGTEFGLYYLHYNDTNPNVVTSFFPTLQYQQEYFGNIQLTGASFSTEIGGVNVAGETSYRSGAAVLVNTADGPAATRGNVWQTNLSAIHTIGPTFLAASQSIAAELSYVRVLGVTPLQGSTELTNTRDAAAFEIAWTLSYKNVFDGWDLDVPMTFAHQFAGNTALAGSLGALNGIHDTQASIGLTFTYMNNLKLGLVYARYMGGANPVTRPLADRDYVVGTATYSF